MRAFKLAVLFCLLSGCMTPEPRTAVYSPAEYAPYARTGTGKITGQAFLKTVGGEVRYGAGNTVALHPATSLTNEWFTKVVVQGRDLVPGDLRANDYRRITTADAEGRFEFNNLPPGEYYVTCGITWGVPSDIGVLPTGGIAYARATVRNGETTKVVVTR